MAFNFKRGISKPWLSFRYTILSGILRSGSRRCIHPTAKRAQDHPVRSAAALIIGDEILNGKTLDRNSHYFAQFCFRHGIQLQRVEVIADDEFEISAASRRMVQDYDLVITSGGIGPTHDDITYASLAKAFSQNLVLHAETLRRMDAFYKRRSSSVQETPQQKQAAHRMALLPDGGEVLFVDDQMWVPVVRLQGKLYVLPGIPTLFQNLLDNLPPFLSLPPLVERPRRIQIHTEQRESMIAPYLTSLQIQLQSRGVRIGSYPDLERGVFVSIIGCDALPSETVGADLTSDRNDDLVKSSGGSQNSSLQQIAKQVEQEIGGRIVSDEEVARRKARIVKPSEIKPSHAKETSRD